MEPFNFIFDDIALVASDADSGNAGPGDDNDIIYVQENQNISDKDCPYVENGMSDFVPRKEYQQVLDKIQVFEHEFAFMYRLIQRIRQDDDSSLPSCIPNSPKQAYAQSKELAIQRVKQDFIYKQQKEHIKRQLEQILSMSIPRLIEKGEALSLEYLDWDNFISLNSIVNATSHPIQVLVGEPGGGVLPNESDVTNKQSQEAKVIVTKDNLGVSDHLPERIKIASESLFNALVQISESFASMSYADSGTIILRPYKILLYCEKKMRDKLAKLEENQASKKGETKTCLPQNDDETISASQTVNLQPENTQSTSKQNDDDSEEDEDEDEDKNEYSYAEKIGIWETLQLRCLLSFIDTKIQPKLDFLCGKNAQDISFNDLWYLYKPGDEVIDQAERQAFRIIRVETPVHKSTPSWARLYQNSDEESSEEPFHIRCVYIDFDGKVLGPVSNHFSISRYDGEKPIRSLPIFPFRFARPEFNRDQLIERGRILLNVTTVKSMYYMGMTVDTKDEVDSQVVIDFNEALAEERNKHWAPNIEPVTTDFEESAATRRGSCENLCCSYQSVHNDAQVDRYRAEDFVQSLLPDTASQHPSLIIYPRPLQEVISGGHTPSEDELVIMTFRVFGFVLRSRKWAKLDLRYLRYEDETNNKTVQTAFERLVLPEGHKDVVQALVTQHFRGKKKSSVRDEQSDLVQGKGKGLIILLHGAPGVGKTTTAEGVAELFKRPLFQITCGDLGTTANEVEKELERNFALASRWGCILLLDEADVFLAQRERKDFVRNGLVAVFLRVLEYYAGILFLTTNRVGDFDEAFASRIHMSLYYPELNREQTEKIFKLNLELIEGRFEAQNRKLEFDDSAILSFAKQHYDEHVHARWNGRQIRNASQTALALAEFDALDKSLALDINNSVKVHLKQGHFATVQKAYLAFSKYLGDVFGTEGDKRAEENQLRARAEELHRSSKSHRKENSHSKYYDTDFQPTNQHINDMYQGNGYSSARGPSPYQQTGHAPTRYGPGGSFGGGQQEPYGHDQPTRLPPSNTLYNQPGIIHDSPGGQQQPNSFSRQRWQQATPITQPQQAMYSQHYFQERDGAHAPIPSRGPECSEFQER